MRAELPALAFRSLRRSAHFFLAFQGLHFKRRSCSAAARVACSLFKASRIELISASTAARASCSLVLSRAESLRLLLQRLALRCETEQPGLPFALSVAARVFLALQGLALKRRSCSAAASVSVSFFNVSRIELKLSRRPRAHLGSLASSPAADARARDFGIQGLVSRCELSSQRFLFASQRAMSR